MQGCCASLHLPCVRVVLCPFLTFPPICALVVQQFLPPPPTCKVESTSASVCAHISDVGNQFTYEMSALWEVFSSLTRIMPGKT